MQSIVRGTEAFPKLYRNRPPSLAFNSPRPEPLRDVIYLVHGSAPLRDEICTCFSVLGVKVFCFTTAAEYLEFARRDSAACLVVDADLHNLSGCDFQQQHAARISPPVIFVSDHRDTAAAVRAIKAGAIEFLTTPIDLPALVSAVQAAFAQDRRQRRRQAELAELQARLSLLTPREREVLPLVVGGLLNKQAAYLLGIAEVTLQIHRSQIMKKTRADSFADLVRMAVKLRIPHWREACPGQTVQPIASLHGLQGGHGAFVANPAQ